MYAVDAHIVKHLPAVRDSPAFQLDTHLQAPSGITVIIGPSGSGKTLFLNCVAGFVRPDRGRILIASDILFDAATKVHLRPERRRCGYIFQDHALFPHMTVRENLRFATSLHGSRRLNRHRRINELLEAFDLAALSDRKPAQLSGGQKQRAALARVLITEPRVLLLDEPSRGLDEALRRTFWELLASFRSRVNIPMLLVSHDMTESCELADSIAMFENGKLLQMGSRQDVFAKPATAQAAHLLGLHNILSAAILALDPAAKTSRLRVLDQEIDGPYLPGHLIGDSGFLCLRRSEMKVVPSNRHTGKDRLLLRLVEKRLSPAGVRLIFENGVFVTTSEADASLYAPDDLLALSMPTHCMAFLNK